jgi:hypothetical protein
VYFLLCNLLSCYNLFIKFNGTLSKVKFLHIKFFEIFKWRINQFIFYDQFSSSISIFKYRHQKMYKEYLQLSTLYWSSYINTLLIFTFSNLSTAYFQSSTSKIFTKYILQSINWMSLRFVIKIFIHCTLTHHKWHERGGYF